jgi:hypothetical protein
VKQRYPTNMQARSPLRLLQLFKLRREGARVMLTQPRLIRHGKYDFSAVLGLKSLQSSELFS